MRRGNPFADLYIEALHQSGSHTAIRRTRQALAQPRGFCGCVASSLPVVHDVAIRGHGRFGKSGSLCPGDFLPSPALLDFLSALPAGTKNPLELLAEFYAWAHVDGFGIFGCGDFQKPLGLRSLWKSEPCRLIVFLNMHRKPCKCCG